MVGLSTLISGLFVVAPVSATTYSHDATVQFTFNSEISVVIDTADIEILDLAPGTSSDSNVVGITISTNNVVGYTASATVGNATYNTTSMTHTNGTNAFTSIATDASQASLSTDNTWGYTTSLDNGSSWANLSGLPIYTDTAKEIAKTTSPASDAIKFKINAKASTSQAAGDYKNVINFTVVANVPPKTLEDVLNENPNNPKDPETNLHLIQSINDEVCEATEAINDSIVVTDIRDHKNYRVVKLKDGNCWMQDNLALDLTMANASSKITSSNTNANSAALNALFGVANRDASTDPNGNLAVAGIVPYVSNDYATDRPMIYTEAQDDVSDQDPIESVRNSKYGIYYSICAASAGSYCYTNGVEDKADTAVDVEYDVCPSNWRLPTSGYYYGYYTSEDYDVDGGELQKLYEYYYNGHGAEIRNDLLLPEAGYFVFPTDSLQNTAYSGDYWSASAALGYLGLFVGGGSNQDYMNPRNYYQPVFGYNIRCIVKTSKLAINFDKNDGYGDMSPQIIKHGHTVKLDKNQYARWDYLFNGWNTKADGTGIGYKDGDTFTATTDSSITKVKLYAQWVEDTGQGSGSLGKTLQDAYEMAYVTNPGRFQKDGGGTKHGLYVPHKTNGVYDGTYFEATQQSDYEGIPAKDLRFAIQDIDMTIDGVKVCDYATVIGSEAYVLDLRDNKSYWITKLADGKCWMTQNLDLDFSSSKTYTPADTDITANWTPERDIGTITITSDRDQAYGYAYSDTDPYGVDPGVLYTYPNSDSSKFLRYSSLSDCVAASNDETGCTHYKVGNWYNWTAALASNDTSAAEYSVADQDFSSSICPRGWQLPTTSLWNGLIDSYIPPNAHIGSWAQIYGEAPIYLNRATHITLVEWGQYIGTFWFDGGDPGTYQVASTVTEPGSGLVVSRVLSWKGCTTCFNEVGVGTGFYTSSYGGYSSKDDGYNVRCVAR